MDKIKAIINLYENKKLITKKEAIIQILKIAYVESIKENKRAIINLLENTFPIDPYSL